MKLLSQYILILASIFLLIALWHFTKNPVLKLIRFWYPFTLLGFLFTSSTKIDRVIFSEALDPYFISLDQHIFGYQPCLVWGVTYDTYFLQEFFHYAYFSYYLMIFGIPLYIYLNREKSEYIRVLFNILFVFFSCYVLYSIFPVIGGRYFPEALELSQTFRHGLFTHIMVFIYQTNDHWGGAFPSSHVALALTISLLSFRYFRAFAWVLFINTIFLSISTVYCHYHYFVDVIGGVIYGFVMYGVSEFIYTIVNKNHNRFFEE
jgi:membrane-associated phospholipid phosphatase